MSGIRTIEDLMARCWVDEDTGCWHFRGRQRCDNRPCMWFPPLGKVVALGTAIGYLRTGERPGKGVLWRCTCQTTDCANPAHRVAGTRSVQMLAMKLKRAPLTRIRMSLGRRGGGKLAEADRAAIRGSAETLRVICKTYGISLAYASMIRSGKDRMQLQAPGGSAFSFGGLL